LNTRPATVGLHPRVIALLVLSIIAFAANSIIARAALGTGAIGAGSFTAIRLATGAIVLGIAVRAVPDRTNVAEAAALLVYAAGFSFAYLAMGAATGALILFAVVQITMFTAAVRSADKPGPMAWLGMAVALAGLAWLLAPGLTAPPLTAALAMAAAGIAWGVYSLLGRRAGGDPGKVAARSFMLAAPPALLLIGLDHQSATMPGIGLAMLSGGVTSGLGYLAWYRALPHVRAGTAAVLQLLTPPLAVVGGVLMLGEALSPRLVWTSALILAGVVIALRAPRRHRR